MRRVAVVLLLLAHDALGRRARKVRNPPQGQREEVPEAAAATRLAERLGLETSASAQLAQLRADAPADGLDADELLILAGARVRAQDHLTAAQFYAAAAAAAAAAVRQPSELESEAAAASSRSAALGLVACGEAYAAVPLLLASLYSGSRPSASTALLQRGLAKGLTAAALGAAASAGTGLIRDAADKRDLVVVIDSAVSAAPLDYNFAVWAAEAYTDVLGEEPIAVPVLNAFRAAAFGRDKDAPWNIAELQMLMLLHEELKWQARDPRNKLASADADKVARVLASAPERMRADALTIRRSLNPRATVAERQARTSLEWRMAPPHQLHRHPTGTVGEVVPLSLPDRPHAMLKTLASNPAVFAVEGFASAEECAALIAAGSTDLVEAAAGGKGQKTVRNNRASQKVHNHAYSMPVRRVLQRATTLVNASEAAMPSDLELQLVHYHQHEHYTLHLDADLGRYALASGLERFVSMFLFLSDVDEGGETIFPEADASSFRRGASCGLSGDQAHRTSNACTQEEESRMVANCRERAPGLVVPPKAGTLLMWYNYREDGTPNTRSVHAGCDVLRGQKLAANLWVNTNGGLSMLSPRQQ